VTNEPRISVIDDDKSVRLAIGRLLKSFGLHAELFASAEEFLRSGRLTGTACLILDVRIPGMSGVELQEQLIASDTRVPIVFISAHGDEAARARALERGAVDFLRKPFCDEALLHAIARATRTDPRPRQPTTTAPSRRRGM
jgi:FixJ family two-component response regulator